MTINSCDELPDGLCEEHGNVMLAVDIMYINKIPFMMTISRGIHFGTTEIIKNEKTTIILLLLKQIIDTYHARGFKVWHFLADGWLEITRKHTEAMGIMPNVTKQEIHVPKLEQYIRTVKERLHTIVNTLPFENYPHRLIVETVYNAVTKTVSTQHSAVVVCNSACTFKYTTNKEHTISWTYT